MTCSCTARTLYPPARCAWRDCAPRTGALDPHACNCDYVSDCGQHALSTEVWVTVGRKGALLQSTTKVSQPGAMYVSFYDLLQRSASLHQGDDSHERQIYRGRLSSIRMKVLLVIRERDGKRFASNCQSLRRTPGSFEGSGCFLRATGGSVAGIRPSAGGRARAGGGGGAGKRVPGCTYLPRWPPLDARRHCRVGRACRYAGLLQLSRFREQFVPGNRGYRVLGSLNVLSGDMFPSLVIQWFWCGVQRFLLVFTTHAFDAPPQSSLD